jgi:subtilisin family serine protease
MGRVFASRSAATQQDLANAVLALATQHRMDLINLSLGSQFKSNILADAIADAGDAGTLCVCAAGNGGGAVMSPARLEGTVAVTALGRSDVCPPSTTAAYSLHPNRGVDAGNGLTFAGFSCYGPEVDCCGPGVGIVSCSPSPSQPNLLSWVAKDGTSMAAPAVCGVLAVLLSRSPQYRSMARDLRRTQEALKVLYSACRQNSLDPFRQGRGMPIVQ